MEYNINKTLHEERKKHQATKTTHHILIRRIYISSFHIPIL